MDFQQFADVILRSESIHDKLTSPDELKDNTTRISTQIPRLPARSPRLRLDHQRAKTPFPHVASFSEPSVRGTVLHFFANHELLATELMALALLKFPTAPGSFRRMLVQTIREEQQHCRLYLDRMEQFGVAFGDVPVTDFFWSTISDMQTPLDYVTRMSLIFEQANLDFSKFYHQAFLDIEDYTTAGILKTVYDEEISHVRRGLQFFDRWRDKTCSRWDCFQRELPFPLTPARAKGGLLFDVEGRYRAGLDEGFINRLNVYSHSKGRLPDLWLFNPSCEQEIATGNPHYSVPQAVRRLERDLGSLMMLLAKTDDIVLCRQVPRPEFLLDLQQLGFTIPEFQALEADGLKQRTLGSLIPWGDSPRVAAFASQLGIGRRHSSKSSDKDRFSKLHSAALFKQFTDGNDHFLQVDLPSAVSSVEEASQQSESLLERGWPQVVIKAPFAASGQDRIRLRPGESLSQSQLGWLNARLSRYGQVLLEPWLPCVRELSLQCHGVGRKSMRVFTQLCDTHGQFRGHLFGPSEMVYGKELMRHLFVKFESRTSLYEAILGLGHNLKSHLQEKGSLGAFGVDIALIQREHVPFLHDTATLPPVLARPLDLNARYSMGSFTAKLTNVLAPHAFGLWLHVPQQQLTELGYRSFVELFAALKRDIPMEHKTSRQIKRGVVSTTDAAVADKLWTVLIVSDRLQDLHTLKQQFDYKL